jgi:hypothetical protein
MIKGDAMKAHKLISIALLSLTLVISAAAQGSKQTFTGVVSDSMCGKQHMTKDAAQCTRACVKSGSDYALVVGDKVYTLKGDKAVIDQFAGKPASVTGTAKGEVLDVTSIGASAK